MQSISEILAAYTPSNNEAHPEEELVWPLPRALGHDFEMQPALTTLQGTKRPDYVFYRNPASLAVNKNRTLDEEVLAGQSLPDVEIRPAWFCRSHLGEPLGV